MGSNRLIKQGIVILFFVCLTAVASRNSLPKLDSIIVGRDPDVYINPWADWWTKKALSEPGTDLWETDYLFFPNGANLTFHSFSHINSAISIGLQQILPTLTAYNFAILINYVLAGIAMFHLAHYLTGSFFGGLLAGIVFAFNSHNIYQSAHPVLVSVWVLPWFTLGILRAYRENSLAWALFAAVMIFAAAVISSLMFLVSFILLVTLFVFLWIDSPRKEIPWRTLLIFTCLSILLLTPIFLPQIRAVSRQNYSFYLEEIRSIPSDILSPFIPRWYIWINRGIYFGIVPFYLGLVAFGRQRRRAGVWFLLLGLAYLFSIGPDVVVLGRSTSISLPWSNLVVPVLRQTHRLNILVSFALSIVAAYGWAAVRDGLSRERTRGILAFVFLIVLIIDYLAAPFPTLTPQVPPFYAECLPYLSDGSAIAIVPSGRQVDKVHMYYQTIHGRKMTGGVISRPSKEVFDFLTANPILQAGNLYSEPGPLPDNPLPHLEEMAARGVGYLIIERGFVNENSWMESIPWEPGYEDNSVIAYDLHAAENGFSSELATCSG